LATRRTARCWFTEIQLDKIGRIPMSATPAMPNITEFSLPAESSSPYFIALGPDRNLWFTDFGAGKIGKITTTGVATEFPLPSIASTPHPTGIVAGPDGALWFTEPGVNKIGRIPTSATVATPGITEYGPLPTANSYPTFITVGPDHQTLYFSEANNLKIGKITTLGAISETTAPGYSSGIAGDPDGNLWITYPSAQTVGNLAPF
jgi:virginiamycin B lyase